MCLCGKYKKQEGSGLCKNCWQPEGTKDPVDYLKKMFGI